MPFRQAGAASAASSSRQVEPEVRAHVAGRRFWPCALQALAHHRVAMPLHDPEHLVERERRGFVAIAAGHGVGMEQ